MTLTLSLCLAIEFGVIFQQPDPPAKLPDLPAFKQQGSEYKQLGKNVWLETNSSGRRVLVAGTICRRDVSLEEFACLKSTKEHESIVSLDLAPRVFHGALLAAGAKSGTVARFDDNGFHAPTGDTLDILVEWTQGNKPQSAKAQDWVRDVKTKKPISHPFVFAGSQEVKHPITGEPYYLGDEGDLISVANFASSIVDLAVKSSTTDSDHSFEAFAERIPEIDTPVVLVIKPASGAGANAASKTPAKSK